MPRVSTAIFDLDGTLVDSQPGISAAFTLALEECLPGRAVPNFTRFIGPPVRQVFRQSLKCEDPALLDELNAAFRRHYDSECWKSSYLYPGTRTLLEELLTAQIACFVLTNKPAFSTGKILAHTGIRPHFARVISPDFVSPPFSTKTDAAHFLFQQGNLDPASTWLIGDSIDDAASAAAVGCHFAAATYGYGGAHAQTEFPVHLTLHHLTEFSSNILFS